MALPKYDAITRNQQAGSNLDNKTRPDTGPQYVQFYEQVFTVPGPSEWFILPDPGPVKVCISFPSGSGSAQLQGTCSPPGVITGIETSLVAGSPVFYDLSETVSATTAILVQGESAIRLNVGYGPAAISIRA
jgi:hypothetical protein